MPKPFTATGVISDAGILTLDQALPLSPGRVRVIVEPLPTREGRSHREVMEAIWERQRRRGHRPPTRSEVDDAIRGERESWDG